MARVDNQGAPEIFDGGIQVDKPQDKSFKQKISNFFGKVVTKLSGKESIGSTAKSAAMGKRIMEAQNTAEFPDLKGHADIFRNNKKIIEIFKNETKIENSGGEVLGKANAVKVLGIITGIKNNKLSKMPYKEAVNIIDSYDAVINKMLGSDEGSALMKKYFENN